jgi:hypothetical protein
MSFGGIVENGLLRGQMLPGFAFEVRIRSISYLIMVIVIGINA